jgi:POT family proton-dependent oligopeptide transporter
MAINIGSMSPLATTVIEQHLGFTSAFALPMVVFFLGLTVLLLSKNTYTSHPPEGSVTTKAARYLWLIVRNKGSFARAKDVASASHITAHIPPWDDAFADDLYLALQACKFFLFYPFFWVAYAQTLTNLVSQAGTMQTHGIPNDILINLDPLAVLLLAPLLEFSLYPLLRRVGIPFRPIARIASGFVVIGLAMAYAAVLQHVIYASPPCYNHPLSRGCLDGRVPNQVHILAQSPVYILVALAEIFGVATGYEYAFKHAPPSMRSFVMAMFLSTAAVGAALGILTSPVFVDPTLVWAYSGLSVAAILAGAAFWAMFKGTDTVKAGA